MRKKDDTLQAALIDIAREIAENQGPDAITIRKLANQAGVASGTVYNYFSSKDDILLILTEEFWRKALLDMQQEVSTGSFSQQLGEIYSFLKARIAGSGMLLMNSLQNVKADGRIRMQAMHKVLRQDVQTRMAQDKNIKHNIWNDKLTQSNFMDFVILNIITLLQTGRGDISTFVEIVNRLLY